MVASRIWKWRESGPGRRGGRIEVPFRYFSLIPEDLPSIRASELSRWIQLYALISVPYESIKPSFFQAREGRGKGGRGGEGTQPFALPPRLTIRAWNSGAHTYTQAHARKRRRSHLIPFIFLFTFVQIFTSELASVRFRAASAWFLIY